VWFFNDSTLVTKGALTNIQKYLLNRQLRLEAQPKYRILCSACAQPGFSCFCAQIKTFDPRIKFVILIHPIEAKRRIATGRMSHLCLQNSVLIKGKDYTSDSQVNALLADPKSHSVMLYPGKSSINISDFDENQKKNLFPTNKNLQVFVIDGTWATARKMVRQSLNLQNLPRISFIPKSPSNFRVRKQPNEKCFSTIEAIHQTIELLGLSQGFDTPSRKHDNLLQTFNYLVENQLKFIRQVNLNPRETTYRRSGQMKIA